MAFGTKAVRKKVALKLGLSAPAGGGKSMGALLIAKGIVEATGRDMLIGAIDTENESLSLYAGDVVIKGRGVVTMPDFYPETLRAPFTVKRYMNAIRAAEEAGIEILIIDSITPEWNGAGGLLERKSNLDRDNARSNPYTNWAPITEDHNRFIQDILQSRMHIICTLRSKVAHEMTTNAQGVTKVTKVGLEPQQRDGMDYEFTVMWDIEHDHHTTVSKDRTGLFEGERDPIDEQIGHRLVKWLNSGADLAAPVGPKPEFVPPTNDDNETPAQEILGPDRTPGVAQAPVRNAPAPAREPEPAAVTDEPVDDTPPTITDQINSDPNRQVEFDADGNPTYVGALPPEGTVAAANALTALGEQQYAALRAKEEADAKAAAVRARKMELFAAIEAHPKWGMKDAPRTEQVKRIATLIGQPGFKLSTCPNLQLEIALARLNSMMEPLPEPEDIPALGDDDDDGIAASQAEMTQNTAAIAAAKERPGVAELGLLVSPNDKPADSKPGRPVARKSGSVDMSKVAGGAFA